MLVEKNNKCCICIIKGTGNLRKKKKKNIKKEDMYCERVGVSGYN